MSTSSASVAAAAQPRLLLEARFDGAPVAKARARKGRGGRGGHWHTPQQVIDAEERIRTMLMSMRARPVAGDVALTLWFYVPDRRRRDLDNLEKLVQDACIGFVYLDDSQIVEKHSHLVRGADDPHTILRAFALPAPLDP